MNADQLIDFVLGQLDGTDHQQIENDIESDPELARKVERLGRTIHRLLDDGEAIEPPAGLARNALALVAQSRLKPKSISDYVPAASPFPVGRLCRGRQHLHRRRAHLAASHPGIKVTNAPGRLRLQPPATGA